MASDASILEKQKEVLGINRRNQDYVRPYNPRSAKIIADNKLITKKVLAKVGIKTPELYKVIRSKNQLEHLDWNTLPKSFVVKPNRGSIGSGIIVFFGKQKNELLWIRPNQTVMDPEEITIHMQRILEGRYSMGSRGDIVLIEERVRTHSTLKRYSYRGVPDIRLIIFNSVPIMAMIRLPTKRSDGKANLHAGAICAGIDIAAGVTTHAMHLRNQPLVEDTYETLDFTIDLQQNLPLSGIAVPFWEDILEIAVKCQRASGLGYMGVDIVIDKDKGPMVLELNARPGLGIQSANNAGLRHRLERVQGLNIKNIKHGIRVAKNLFGGEVETEIEVISGKQVVNLVERVSLGYVDNPNKKEVVNAMLDTGISTSRIDIGLANRIGFAEGLKDFGSNNVPTHFDSFTLAQKYIDEHAEVLVRHPYILRLAKITEEGKIKVKPVIGVDVKIAGQVKHVEAVVSTQSDMIYPMLVGRTELKEYLIDASKTFSK